MLNIGQTTTALNLAQALRDEQGTFLCRQGNQDYITVSAHGHSIVSGPTPYGPPVAGVVQISSLAAEPWFITKISNQAEDQGQQQQQGAQQQYTVR